MENLAKTPIWFWIASGIALLWNLMGVSAYVAQLKMTAADIAAMPVDQRTLYENFPMWANIAFAISVFAGALGCIGLLMRKKWSLPVLGLSLLGVIGHMVHNITSGAINFSEPATAILPGLILVVAIALLGLAKKGIGERIIA